MENTINGKLVSKLEKESGTSKAGKDWEKQSIVVDTGRDFNPLVCISFFGDKIEAIKGLKKDDFISVSINIASREHKGKWYHNIDGWKVDMLSEEAPAELNTSDADDGSDLPF